MAEHKVHGPGEVGGRSAAAGHEVTDADPNPLAKVGIALAGLVLAAFVLMILLFRIFAYYQPLFDDDAVAAIFDVSSGVPRRINRIGTSAMIVAAARKRQIVNAQDVHDARVDRGRA